MRMVSRILLPGKLISFCSTNLTTIYFIQWLVIAYAVAVMVVRERDGTDSPFVIFGVAIAVMILSVWIASLIRKIKTRKAQRAKTE